MTKEVPSETAALPDLTIRECRDAYGRVFLAIPDVWAIHLRRWAKANWTEIHGFAYGFTPRVQEGPIADALAAIHAACQRTDHLATIGGESFRPGEAEPEYSLLVSNCGISYVEGRGYYLAG